MANKFTNADFNAVMKICGDNEEVWKLNPTFDLKQNNITLIEVVLMDRSSIIYSTHNKNGMEIYHDLKDKLSKRKSIKIA